MAYADATSSAPAGKGGDKERYLDAIDRYDRGTATWRLQCEAINKIYLDQHRTTASARRFAMLWSNIETLKPAVYARTPVAVVSRRFKDQDKIGRKAGETLERCINTSFDLYGVDMVLQSVRDDRLLCARGSAWVRYEAEFEAGTAGQSATPSGAVSDTAGDRNDPGQAADQNGEKLTSEHVCTEFVHWADFGHELRRTWPEVNIVWRRVYMDRGAVEKRWGKEQADKLNFSMRPEYAQRYGPDIKDATEPQAVIYELWDKTRKKTVWISKDEKILLESGKPPLNFRDFFPCPRPAYGTLATGSLIPTPDYRYYQDQAEEINDLTEKIAALQEWLVLKAFIPAGPSSEGSDAIISMLQALSERASSKGIFVPVESWSGFTERGGARMIDWLPMDMVIGTIKAAIECRQALINDVYQITGISDILRGETDPNETLGAQEIKAQTGSRRIQTCQRDLARFARDLAELVGEVIAEVFQPKTIAAMSGYDMTVEAPPQLLSQAQLLMGQIQQLQAPPPQMALPSPGMMQ